MTTVKVARWGNSQGIIIPKKICVDHGIQVGDSLTITEQDGAITLEPVKRRKRARTSIKNLFEGWDGTYETPAGYAAGCGKEIDWGEPQGSETR